MTQIIKRDEILGKRQEEDKGVIEALVVQLNKTLMNAIGFPITVSEDLFGNSIRVRVQVEKLMIKAGWQIKSFCDRNDGYYTVS